MQCSCLVLALLTSLAFTVGHEDPAPLLQIDDSPLVTEADVTLTVCVSVFGTLNNSASVTLTTIDDTAKAGADYLPLDIDVEFTESNSDPRCFSLTILDDEIVETSEVFSVELVNIVGLSLDLESRKTITIIPDIDTITVAFEQSPYTVDEGEGQVRICLQIVAGGIDEEKPAGLDVGLSFISDTASAGLDFLDINPEFTFPVGSTVGDTACVTVSIVDDTLIESTEQFTASLDNAEAVSVNNDENAVLVKIEDNDDVRLLLDPTTVQYLKEANPGEFADSVELCITADADGGGVLERSVIVSLELSGGTADLADFELSTDGILELTTLQTPQCITLALLNDDVREFNETVTLTPVPENPKDQVVGNGFTIIIIGDGDENCPLLSNPANGRVILTDRSEGSRAVYECDSNYILSGGTSRECGADGRWTGEQPQCLSDCGLPPASHNDGSVSFTTTTEGALAEYTCFEDHILIGSSTIQCLPSRVWSGDAPVCLASCRALSKPENGVVDVTSTIEGSTATYSCFENFTLYGDEYRTCRPDAEWSGSQPHCLPYDSIPCPDLEDPLNGQVRSDGVRAMYSCQDSYILVGTSVRECSIEVGEWLGNEPQCSNGVQVSLSSFLLLGVLLLRQCIL